MKHTHGHTVAPVVRPYSKIPILDL